MARPGVVSRWAAAVARVLQWPPIAVPGIVTIYCGFIVGIVWSNPHVLSA